MSDSLTRARYIRVLQVFHAFFSQWECVLDQTCPDSLRSVWLGRRRTSRLQQDLLELSASTDPALNLVLSSESVSGSGHWLGSVYVLEGSTLGGQVISRFLERHFGWSGGRGYSYFQGYRDETAMRWKQVCAALEEAESECNQILEGAHHMFHTLDGFLEAHL